MVLCKDWATLVTAEEIPTEMDTQEQLRRLIECVRLIASDPKDQLESLPDQVCKTDEIALEFSNSLQFLDKLVASDLISAECAESLRYIDHVLDRMSREHPEVWSDDALADSSLWASLRQAAAIPLSLLGATPAKPRLDWLRFVSCDDDE